MNVRNDEEKMLYLKGYSEGFKSAMKLAWYEVEMLLYDVNDQDKEFVKRVIDKLKS